MPSPAHTVGETKTYHVILEISTSASSFYSERSYSVSSVMFQCNSGAPDVCLRQHPRPLWPQSNKDLRPFGEQFRWRVSVTVGAVDHESSRVAGSWTRTGTVGRPPQHSSGDNLRYDSAQSLRYSILRRQCHSSGDNLGYPSANNLRYLVFNIPSVFSGILPSEFQEVFFR